MNTYISLLRGINVSGQKKIIMKDLKSLYENMGFKDVTSYIQSGNLIFKSSLTKEATKKLIEHKIFNIYSFNVEVFIETKLSIKEVINKNPFLNNPKLEPKNIYFTILNNQPESHSQLTSSNYGNSEFNSWKNIIYLYCPNGYGKSKLNNNFIEKKLNTKATTRNLRTMLKLNELAANTSLY